MNKWMRGKGKGLCLYDNVAHILMRHQDVYEHHPAELTHTAKASLAFR